MIKYLKKISRIIYFILILILSYFSKGISVSHVKVYSNFNAGTKGLLDIE